MAHTVTQFQLACYTIMKSGRCLLLLIGVVVAIGMFFADRRIQCITMLAGQYPVDIHVLGEQVFASQLETFGIGICIGLLLPFLWNIKSR